MITETPKLKPQRQRKQDESKLQSDCFKWLWHTYPETRGLYFAVLNENDMSKYETPAQQKRSGAMRKARGVVSGVSDSILLIGNKQYHGFCIEFKTPIGVQSEAQKEWQANVERSGYKYILIRDFDDFKKQIEEYFANK
jgi:hypothetical protein